MKLAIHSGEIPSSSFIEQLIIGLAEKNNKIILHGFKTKNTKYNLKNITIIGYSDYLDKIFISIKYGILLLFLKPIFFYKLIHTCFKKSKNGSFFNHWSKIAPFIWYQPDIFHIQWAKSLPYWYFLKSRFNIKIVVSLRGVHINYSPIIDEKLATNYRKYFPLVDQFHAVSQAIKAEALKYGAIEEKISVIYSCVNHDSLELFLKSSTRITQPLKLLSVGRWHWIKGYQYAIDMVYKLRKNNISVQYTVIADGNPSEEILYQIYNLGLNDVVHFREAKEQEDVYHLMTESHCLLLPSIEEGISNSILEAMSIGLPVISSDCGGMNEVIKHGTNGFLVKPRSSGKLVKMIQILLNLKDGDISKIANNGRKTIEHNHNLKDYISKFEIFYKKVFYI